MSETTENIAQEKSKILIVDDLATNLQVLAKTLHNEGYTVFMAMSGKQAISMATAKQPDLILCDVNMPEMDGFETVTILKSTEVTKEIPVIFITALSEIDDVLKGFDVGAIDYVTKPFRSQELLARVSTQLDLMKSRQMIMRQKSKLEELNTSKDKFFSIISHDLRGPFQASLGLTDLIASNPDSFGKNEVVDIIMKINKNQKNLYKLIENLLDWSRVQTNAIDYNPINIKVLDKINFTFDMLKDMATQKEIELVPDSSDTVQVFADDFMFSTVVRNLVSNAIKFTKNGGKITVHCLEKDDTNEIVVEDNGVGMDEEGQKKLFRIDLHATTVGTNKEKGTGLGLILCKEFVEMNGGKIWVESEKGVGSKFIFSVPKEKN